MPLGVARSRYEFLRVVPSALASGSVKTIQLPAKIPNLNAFAERWVRSVKQECPSKLILFGEGPRSRVLNECGRHYRHQRNQQGRAIEYSSSM